MKYVTIILLTLCSFLIALPADAGNGRVKETHCEKVLGGYWDHASQKCIGGSSSVYIQQNNEANSLGNVGFMLKHCDSVSGSFYCNIGPSEIMQKQSVSLKSTFWFWIPVNESFCHNSGGIYDVGNGVCWFYVDYKSTNVDEATTMSFGPNYTCENGILHENGQSTGVTGKAVCTSGGGEVWLSCSGNRLVAFRFSSRRYCEGN